MMSTPEGRWETYLLVRGEDLRTMLREHFAQRARDVRFFMGKGFDPRMNLGIETVLAAGGSGKREVTLVEFDEGDDSPSKAYADRVQTNLEGLTTIAANGASLSRRTVNMWSSDNERRRITSRSAEAMFTKKDCEGATDIIVDISSLPRGIFYPVVAKLLYLLDKATAAGLATPNLIVLVSENPVLDGRIREEGISEDADYVHPFRGSAEREATANYPKVWLPILGEGQGLQLTRINELVRPDEICPVVPSPAMDPRRADRLVQVYRGLLFDALRVDPRNFIYASELNPFEAYRQLRRAIVHYAEALKPLGGCRSVVTSVSSKLLSMAALLAVYELKVAKYDVGIAQVECDGYRIIDEGSLAASTTHTTPCALWLSGELYA
jgi:hypothetical protein